MTLPQPERIGRFRVVGLLGQGAMGVVYRGRDDVLERDLALKVMAAAALADADSRQRFLREARASARLQHPNIVTIYELGEHEGQPFMALELLEGLDLQRAVEAGIRPDPKVILPVVLQMLAGLGHAHAHGVVHRDVKPSNVFIPHGRPVKIMDFGVARLAATTLTSAGTVLGTPSYMSPEQVRGDEVDGRSDLFSAGLILYELLTGEKAFRAGSLVSVLYKIAHEPPDLSLLPKSGSWNALRAVLERVLARDAAARYPDAATLSRDLVHALVALGGTPEWSLAPDLALLTLAAPRPRVAPADTWHAAPTQPAEAPRGGVPQVPLARSSGPLTDLPLLHDRGPLPATSATELPLGERPSAPAAIERSVSGSAAARTRPAWRSPAALVLAGGAVALVMLLALLAGRGRRVAAPSPAPPATAARAPSVVPTAPSRSPATALPARPSREPGSNPTALPAPATPLPRATSPESAPPRAPATPAAVAATSAGPATPIEARLERAERLLEEGRYATALSEAKAVLARAPDNDEARDIVQEAEALLLVESSLKSAREAWQHGDRERARTELQRGLAVRPNDARLLKLWREITG